MIKTNFNYYDYILYFKNNCNINLIGNEAEVLEKQRAYENTMPQSFFQKTKSLFSKKKISWEIMKNREIYSNI